MSHHEPTDFEQVPETSVAREENGFSTNLKVLRVSRISHNVDVRAAGIAQEVAQADVPPPGGRFEETPSP